jgi:hypothetical protein
VHACVNWNRVRQESHPTMKSSSLFLTALSSLSLIVLAAACASPAPAPQKDSKNNNSTTGNKDNDKDNDKDDGKDKASNGPSNEKPPTDPGEDLEAKDFLDPPVVNTGFTGGAGQAFKVPMFTDMEGTLTWKAADPTMVDIVGITAPADYTEAKSKDPKVPAIQFAMLTTKKAGSTKVTVTNGTKTFDSDVVIKSYTAAQYTLGQTRYKTGEGTAARQPCAGCHEKPDGADHSPSWIALFDDDDVLGAIQTATYTKDDSKYQLNKGNHKWTLTEEEKAGIMAFLRGLSPKGY